MRSASFIPVLVVLALAGVVHAEGSFSGSILRLDEHTYRVVIQGSIPVPVAICPVGNTMYCCRLYVSQFAVKGPFGLPGNVMPSGEREEEGELYWYSTGSITGVQFEFAASPSQQTPMTFECWGAIEFAYDCQDPTAGEPNSILLRGEHAEAVYGALPTRVGDSAPLQPTVAVESTPWAAVKQLYRE